MITDDVFRQCQKLLSCGGSVEDVIRFLRESGLSKVHSMKTLVDLGIVDLAKAKLIVHRSSTWIDVRERDEEFQRKLDPKE